MGKECWSLANGLGNGCCWREEGEKAPEAFACLQVVVDLVSTSCDGIAAYGTVYCALYAALFLGEQRQLSIADGKFCWHNKRIWQYKNTGTTRCQDSLSIIPGAFLLPNAVAGLLHTISNTKTQKQLDLTIQQLLVAAKRNLTLQRYKECLKYARKTGEIFVSAWTLLYICVTM